MKVLIIQENGRNKENRHMRECHSLQYWMSMAGIEATCWGKGHPNFNIPFDQIRKNFDIIFCLENYNNGWLPNMKIVDQYKIFWSIDSHCELNSHVEFCKESKINLHLNSAPGYIKHFEPFVDKCVWFPNSIDTRWIKPINVEKTDPIGFIGSMIADRPQLIPVLQNLVGLSSYSNILGEEMVMKINSFQIGFNKSISDDINYRIFETTGCQVPLITNNVPGLDRLYNPDQEILVYSNFKELLGCCIWLLKDETARKELAIEGYKRTILNHTVEKRISALKSILESA